MAVRSQEPRRRSMERSSPRMMNRLVPVVGMVVTPRPVCFLISLFRLAEIYVFAMILFFPPTVSLVFVLAPGVIIVMVGVMILAIVRAQR